MNSIVITNNDTVINNSDNEHQNNYYTKDDNNNDKKTKKHRRIAFAESTLSEPRCVSSLSSGYGTKSPTSVLSCYERNSNSQSSRDSSSFKTCERRKIKKKRLSVSHSPFPVEYPPCPHHRTTNSPSHEVVEKQPQQQPQHAKVTNNSEEALRREQITKLEHKMSGQPYRLHRAKNPSEMTNEMAKLMFLKNPDLGREFLRSSKRRVISIPSKRDYPAVHRERLEEYAYS